MTRNRWFGHRIAALAATVGMAGALAALAAAPAAAHEARGAGRYRLVVGFGEEPAYVGEMNSVQVKVTDAAGRPVTNLGGGLKVVVTQRPGDGTQPLGKSMAQGLADKLNEQAGTGPALRDRDGRQPRLSLTLEPSGSAEPGDYRAWLVPTEPGSYSFHISGSIKGQRVDQRFSSSPETFSEVLDPKAVQFPAKEPSGAELAARIDREVPRLQRELSLSALRADRAAGQTAAARRLAVAGLSVGAIGLVAALALTLAVVALRRQPARRPRRAR